MVYASGCATAQRDFTQAAPAQPSGFASATSETADLAAVINTALSREGFDATVLDRTPTLIHLKMAREGGSAGELIAVRPEPDSAARVVEVRLGLLAASASEQRLASALAESLTDPPAATPAPASQEHQHWSSRPVAGRWVDLEFAVRDAGSSKSIVDTAIVSVDRWRFATIFTLRTLSAEEARLIIVGDRLSDAGPLLAYMRIGLFGHAQREEAFLERFADEMRQWSRVKRLPDAR